MFHIVDDGVVVLRSKGVWKQTKAYTREIEGERAVFAGHGSGFIRLFRNGGTSVPTISWDQVELPNLKTDYRLSRMIVKE